jgi:hypothetical protein
MHHDARSLFALMERQVRAVDANVFTVPRVSERCRSEAARTGRRISDRPQKKDSFLSGWITGNARRYWASAISIAAAYAHLFK